MTTLIQQKSRNDCALAAIAMAAGKEKWEDLWTQEDLDKVIASRGISDHGPWLARAGLKEHRHWLEVYTSSSISPNTLYAFLWKRPAILSVHSLNNKHGSHAVYWDGEELFDPHTGHEDQGLLAYKWLTSLCITRVILIHRETP